MRKSLLALSICFVFTKVAFAQEGTNVPEIKQLLLAADDANVLLENYLTPAFRGLTSSLNGGWYTTAKTHRLLGFDISLGVNYAFIPASDKMFTFDNKDYKYLSVSSPNGRETLPTIFGEKSTATTLTVEIPYNGSIKKADFDIPAIGYDLGDFSTFSEYLGIPFPIIQLGIGLPLRTDVRLRFLPQYRLKDANFSYKVYGFCVQHDLLQYFKTSEGRRFFNLSGVFGFTTATIDYKLNTTENTKSVTLKNDGFIDFDTKAWTAQLIGSLDVAYILTVYGSLGYNSGASSFAIKGDYDLNYTSSNETITDYITDPIALNYRTGSFRKTLGARLNFTFFKVFADYTMQDYNLLTAGVAFSFDWPKLGASSRKAKPERIRGAKKAKASNKTAEEKDDTLKDTTIEKDREQDQGITKEGIPKSNKDTSLNKEEKL